MANLLVTNFSQRNIFIWNNRFNSQAAEYTDSGSGSTLAAGIMIGRISATGKVKQCITTATDGSQIPIGILLADYEVAASASVDLTFGIAGDVDSGMIVFGGSPADTLSSAVFLNDGTTKIGTVLDVLNGKGILPIATNEMTYEDTQA
jgi:hypothetical protein